MNAKPRRREAVWHFWHSSLALLAFMAFLFGIPLWHSSLALLAFFSGISHFLSSYTALNVSSPLAYILPSISAMM